MDHSQTMRLRSVMEVRTFLHTAGKFHNSTSSYLSDRIVRETLKWIHELVPAYEEALSNYHDVDCEVRRKKAERKEARKTLRLTVSDFWSALKRLHRRKKYDKHDLQLYRRFMEYGPLKLGKTDDTLSIAKQFIKGDKQAVAKGLRGVKDPTPDELQDAIDAVDAADYFSLERRLDRLRGILNERQQEARDLHATLNKRFRLVHRELPASNLRRLMRIVGFRFKYLPPEEESNTEGLTLEHFELEQSPELRSDPKKLEAQDLTAEAFLEQDFLTVLDEPEPELYDSIQAHDHGDEPHDSRAGP